MAQRTLGIELGNCCVTEATYFSRLASIQFAASPIAARLRTTTLPPLDRVSECVLLTRPCLFTLEEEATWPRLLPALVCADEKEV